MKARNLTGFIHIAKQRSKNIELIAQFIQQPAMNVSVFDSNNQEPIVRLFYNSILLAKDVYF